MPDLGFTQEEWMQMAVNADVVFGSDMMAMLDEHGRWERPDPRQLVFRHETGVMIQLRMDIVETHCAVNTRDVVIWMEGMPPFRLIVFTGGNHIRDFYNNFLRAEARSTMDKVGVIAKLCRETQ